MPFYHVWFSPKRRKWLLQGEVAESIKGWLMDIASDKGIKLIACETMVDHVHLLVHEESPTTLSRSMNLLKGITSRRVFAASPEIKLDAGIGAFWQHRYGSKEISEEAVPRVTEYIRTQWARLEHYDR